MQSTEVVTNSSLNLPCHLYMEKSLLIYCHQTSHWKISSHLIYPKRLHNLHGFHKIILCFKKTWVSFKLKGCLRFIEFVVFVSYLEPRSTLGHWQGDSFTHQITLLLVFHPLVHQETRNEVGSHTTAERPVGFESWAPWPVEPLYVGLQ